jgi:hypothetical protein
MPPPRPTPARAARVNKLRRKGTPTRKTRRTSTSRQEIEQSANHPPPIRPHLRGEHSATNTGIQVEPNKPAASYTDLRGAHFGETVNIPYPGRPYTEPYDRTIQTKIQHRGSPTTERTPRISYENRTKRGINGRKFHKNRRDFNITNREIVKKKNTKHQNVLNMGQRVRNFAAR